MQEIGSMAANKTKKTGLSNFINKVIQGDCLDLMKQLPDRSIDMILCDLPYGTTQNKWDSVIDLEKLWIEYERIIKDNGAIALTSQGIFTAKLMLSNEKLFKYKIVWIKSKSTNFLNAKIQPLRKHEDICIFYKKQPTYNPQMASGEAYDKGIRKDQFTGSYGDFRPKHVKSDGERYPNDVVNFEEQPIDDFVYVKTAESEGKVVHPTQKPIELGRYLVKTYTKPGDIVLDNACGSGSFLLSAILENRQFIGIEKNEDVLLHKVRPVDYIRICNDRMKEILKNKEEASALV
jgi:site-specific DNA-methyltransferase (adenine-specific)